MPTIYIENRPYEVEQGQNLLRACLSLGFDVPYFCWHPALHSVGSCRQCAVKQFKDEKDTKGRIVMSCMTPAEDGTRISIDDPDVKRFRASVIQWLMLNHPHDCPVCDEGGECHLQDMTVMTGHVYRKTRFKKRTFKNQDLGPFIHHEMNRCIQCYRCVRFYCDYAGGTDLNVFGVHDRLYYGRMHDGPLESELSGNLVEICPTGVFTDRTLRTHYTRKWDLQTAPSVCVHCGLGCNTVPGERYGMLRRVRNRYNSEVNGYFLCDRGRYGYEFVNSDRRVRSPLWRGEAGGSFEPVSGPQAVDLAASLIGHSSGVVGIGSPRASMEANYVLRQLVGPENFSMGVSSLERDHLLAALHILESGPARSASLGDIARADAVLVLGEDVTNTAPMMALQVRQAVRNRLLKEVDSLGIDRWNAAMVNKVLHGRRGPLYVATPFATRLDEIATRTFRSAPQEIARLGFAVVRAVNGDAPPVEGMDQSTLSLADAIASDLMSAERPLIVSGVSCGDRSVMEAAGRVAWALVGAGVPGQLSLVIPECNSLGVALMGGSPLEEALDKIRDGNADTLIVLENDLYRRTVAGDVDRCLAEARHVIVLDHLMHDTARKAELLLPAGTFAESDGTLVNSEGRGQRFYQVFIGEGEVRPSWRWIRDVMAELGRFEGRTWRIWDDILNDLARGISGFERLLPIEPSADYRIAGQRIPRQPHRYSGRTAMTANVSVHEPAPHPDPDSALSFSMEGFHGISQAPLIPRYWAPGWNSVQALNKFQEEVGGPLRGNGEGTRLVEPGEGAPERDSFTVPLPFEPRPGERLVIAGYHIFGSEELSALSPAIAERSLGPFLGLNPDDGMELGLREGELATCSSEDNVSTLPVRLMQDLAKGLALIPVGAETLGWTRLPTWIKIEAATKEP